MTADQAQLAAGGFVPASTKLGKGDVVDTVVARAYRHPVLPGRTVVRLVAEGVVAGDELEMATLGFGAGENRGAVAKERKRPLGFPGWALVNDPKNARYALDVVKELKKVARRAKSKPGAAKEGFDKIATRLGKTVPHFLPSFYEEAGRIFLEHGAASFAATYFGKAREAEAVHALEVDEQHRVDGFLEFALAGAVTTKALSQYGKELGEHHKPADAYAHFRKLAVQRTLGGMPPWSGMGKDLQRLAKAAKLDIEAEDRSVVSEIIASPAIVSAAAEFWRAYRDAIRDLANEQPHVRALLLNMFPKGATYSAEADLAWLDLLDETGAMTALVDGDPEVRPTGGRAAWFDRLVQHLGRSWQHRVLPVRAFEILRELAPKLVEDGTPIRGLGRRNQLDLDLVEHALELGVPVAVTSDPHRAWMSPRFNLDQWAANADKPEHGRDPVKTAAHPELGPILVKAVEDALGKDAFDRVSSGKAGFLVAKRAWLEQQLGWAETQGLPVLVETLERLRTKARATLFADLPDLHARFAKLDVAPALAKSLQIGMIDELGWPALEAVMKELSPDGKTPIVVSGGPPALVCGSPTKLVAVGTDGRLGEHDLVVPPKHEFLTARFIGGQFLVVLKEGSTAKGYWSSNVHDLFTEPEVYAYQLVGLAQRATITAEGAWLEGSKSVRAGDRTFPDGQELRAHDGTTTWIVDPNDASKWRELSPTGEKGRASWPREIEAVVEDGWKIDATSSYLFPTGYVDGAAVLSGVAVLYKTDNAEPPKVTHRRVVAIGGPSWTGVTAMSATALLSLPGGEPRVVSEQNAYRDGITSTIWDPSMTTRGSIVASKDRSYSRAQAWPLSPMFWTHYQVRDEAGSKRLRSITTGDATALIAAVPTSANGETPSGVPDETFAKVLPEVSNPDVRNGITGFVNAAVRAQQTRDLLVKDRAPGMAIAPKAAQSISDVAVNTALENWTERTWNKTGATWREIAAVGDWLAQEDRSNRYVHELAGVGLVHLDWFVLAPVRSALAFAALAIGTPADQRTTLAAIFAHLARSLPQGGKLRVYGVVGAHDFPGGSHPGVDARWHDGNAYVVRKRAYNDLYRVLEYAPDGTFKAPPSGRVCDEQRSIGSGLPADALGEIEAALAAGKTSWNADAAARIAAATGLSSSAAAYLWAGIPNIHDRGANFLAKELREQLGLKATQAALGRDSISGVRDIDRLQVFEECARAGVAAMLDGSAADVLANAWVRQVGKRIAVPESLIAEADSTLEVTGQPAHWLSVFAAPDKAPQLTTDGTFGFERGGDLVRVGKAQPLVGQDKITDAATVFDSSVVLAAAQYLPFLYAELPVGDDLRASAVRAHELLLKRLENPALWFDGGVRYMTQEEQAAADRMLDSIGGTTIENLADGLRGVRVPGAAVFRLDGRAFLKLHPATLDARATPLVDKLVATVTSYGNAAYGALKYVRSPGLAQMMARIRDTPVPKGGWEQNPALSVPTLVDKVAKKLGVPADAAALYLQYLVLLWPTPKNLVEWNGWKPKQLADAQAVLVKKDLVVAAKRERAQRGHFLPGGWEALKSPHPPMESWKLAMYGVRDASGNPQPPNQRFLALAPFHTMFEVAWERIGDNDTPRYDEVKR